MEHLLKFVEEQYPAGFDVPAMLSVFMTMIVFMVFLGGIGHLIHKNSNSGLSHSVSTACSIFFAYTIFILIYCVDHDLLQFITSKLPLISLDGDYVSLYIIKGKEAPELCVEFLQLYIMTFIVIALDDMIQDAKNPFTWYLLQFTLCIFSIFVYSLIIYLFESLRPDFLESYAPLIAISITVAFVALGILWFIANLTLTVVNPLLGAVHDFMIGQKLGNCIYKAAICSLLLIGLVWYLGNQGYVTLNITEVTLLGYVPWVLMVLMFWYLLGVVI